MTYERNAATNFVAAAVDALGRRTEFSYDGMGNVTQVKQLAGTANVVTTGISYSANFNLPVTVTDALNHTVTIGYDAKGNVITVRDALNNTVSIGYNVAGQPITVMPPGLNAVTMEYTGGLLTGVVNALGQRVTRSYDGIGRMVAVTDPLGYVTRMEYDGLNAVAVKEGLRRKARAENRRS